MKLVQKNNLDSNESAEIPYKVNGIVKKANNSEKQWNIICYILKKVNSEIKILKKCKKLLENSEICIKIV